VIAKGFIELEQMAAASRLVDIRDKEVSYIASDNKIPYNLKLIRHKVIILYNY